MILVDSNIIIDFWKNPRKELEDIFIKEEIATCGIIKAELIHGATSDSEIEKITEALSDFTHISVGEYDWKEIGVLLYRLRKNGLTVPFQDAVIAYLAVKSNIAIWTYDKHFLSIAERVEGLNIYVP